MEARWIRAVCVAALLVVSLGARARTPNFVVETHNPQLAQRFAQAAEQYRRELAIEWLGRPMPNWAQPCLMTVQVGAGLGAGGATTFVFHGGEVFGWRMTIQGSEARILDSVLPHEITHMIFASHFRCPVPRWADEGAATAAENPQERHKHRLMLVQFLKTGRGIAFDRMLTMTQYPRDIMPLYAQGFSLADYLIQRGGKRKFLAFLGEGMEDGQWAAALQRHYSVGSVRRLQDTWLAWVRQGSPRLDAPSRRSGAAAATAVAATGPRPRPQPNLIYHVSGRDSRSYAPGSVVPPEKADRWAVAAAGPRQRPAASKPADTASPRDLLSVSSTSSTSSTTSPAATAAPPVGAPTREDSGWYAAGTNPPADVQTTPARPSPPKAIRGHLVRPQPVQHVLPNRQWQPPLPLAPSGCSSFGCSTGGG